jgi:hypothetical protein
MESNWVIPLLGTVVALAVVGIFLLVRAWPRHPQLSPEERVEMADAPMPLLQKRAWWSFAIGMATLGTIAVLLADRGAVEYWENDSFRLTVLGIFIGGLFAHVAILLRPSLKGSRGGGFDERDRSVLSRAPHAQSAAVILALAAWMIYLAERFHDQGAIPVVYLYLIFGTAVLVNLIGQSAGILLGYWIGADHGES